VNDRKKPAQKIGKMFVRLGKKGFVFIPKPAKPRCKGQQ
jgi:hypothetical protein